jgi:hypothetical protein
MDLSGATDVLSPLPITFDVGSGRHHAFGVTPSAHI